MTLTEAEVELLQKRSPYALDRKIWMELKVQGLPVLEGDGDYIDTVI